MTITLLFDLDDTLLETNTDTFIPAYFKALSSSLSHLVPPESMIAALMGGTRAMMSNLDPALTLKEVFDAHFFPRLGMDRPSVQPEIDRFYDEVFPGLGTLTKPIPAALALMEWAFAQGYRVAIATNPLFPLKAIQHRLRWAGLAPEKFPYSLITSYENCHFTKETVAYYPEVLAQLGWPEDPVVMVGDDIDREVKPTQSAGLPVYLVRKSPETSFDATGVPQGTLESFRGWLEGTDPDTLRYKFQTPQATLANLRSTPAALASLTGMLDTETWATRPKLAEWNLTEVICHLRDVEMEVHLPAVRAILDENNPFLAGKITEPWVKERIYSAQDGSAALHEFLLTRKATISHLETLKNEWSRPARHSMFGPTNLLELVGFFAAHDRSHIQQVWNLIRSN